MGTRTKKHILEGSPEVHKRQILERLIDRKFGAAPTDHDLITECDGPNSLDAAVDTVMDATTKDEVLQYIR